jgi:hypothetical protein
MSPASVDARTADALWDLFTVCFGPLRRRAAARHLLSRDDFAVEVLDARVAKYLAWTANGDVVGLATLSNDLETVPWISSDFYKSRYTEHFARRSLFYCGTAMVRPDARSAGALRQMVAAIGRDIAAVDGILSADMCRFNVDILQLAAVATSTMQQQWGSVNQVELDRQVYMAWEPRDLVNAGERRQPELVSARQ